MNLHEAISQFIVDTRGTVDGMFAFSPTSSIGLFLPELTLCATIVLMLLVRVFSSGRRLDAFWFALIGSGTALFLASVAAPMLDQRVEVFTGMLVYDRFAVFMRTLLLLFAVLFAILTKLTGIPNREDAPDIYTLVLGATLGMCLMISANHLMMVFMAIEMASVPSYALAALLKHRARASEASLKYVVYGGATSGVMLYGISLITGIANSAHLPTVAAELAQRLPTLQGDERMVLVLGGLMLMVGLAFKLSAVPFHFWCPDVFEGATAEINAFLSVASKAAALGLLVRVAIGIGVSAPPALPTGLTGGPSAETCLIEADSTDGLVALAGDRAQTRFAEIRRRAWEPPSRSAIPTLASGFRLNEAMAHAPLARATTEDSAAAGTNLSAIQDFIAKLITLLAIITCTFGNLAAYGQTNIKRLFAYSTIAHAGYMMMAVPPVMALAGTAPALAEKAAAALGIYVAVYLFMNLAAFAVIAFLRNAMQSEEIADYAGLVRHCPGLVIFFSITLFGLIGLPPLSGFVGKFAIFASLAEGFGATGQAYLLGLLLVGAVNTAISLFYYVRVVKVMTIDPDAETRGPVAFPLVSLPGIYVVAVTLPTVALFFLWNFLNEYALAAARQLLG